MITISINAVLMAAFQLSALIIIAVVAAVVVLWPTNDKPAGWLRYTIYATIIIVSGYWLFFGLPFSIKFVP